MDNHFITQLLRIAFVICLYFLTLASYLTPILITKYWKSKTLSISSPSRAIQSKQYGNRIISWFNCTSIGIFLAMCFLGILPNVKDMFQTIFQKLDYNIKFPVTECVIVTGFILTLLMEQSILTCREKAELRIRDDYEQNQGLLEECEMQDLSDELTYLHEEQEHNLVDDLPCKPMHHSTCSENCHSSSPDVLSLANHVEHGHERNHMSLLIHRGGGFGFFVLALATGLHSIFEGITLGLQTSASKAVHLFIAIITHQCLVAAALGINSTRLRYSFFAYLKFAIVLSAVMPIGVLIGVLIEHAPGTGGEIASAVLQGLSAGIFLHATFQDFLPSEFSNSQDRILKVFFVVFGFIIIAIVTFFIS